MKAVARVTCRLSFNPPSACSSVLLYSAEAALSLYCDNPPWFARGPGFSIV
jgi:hypothetical protein